MSDGSILHEDDHIIVLHKEPYFPVQCASLLKPDCISKLKALLKERDKVMGEPYIGLVHRLDEPVEGILVFAKTEKAAGILSKELQDNGFSKEYTAAVVPSRDTIPKEAVLKDYILTEKKNNLSRTVPEGTKGAKRAELEYRTERELSDTEGNDIRLLRVLLYTGRHHQIRVQLAKAGLPIAGDRKYGNVLLTLPLCLAATGLSFTHPETGERMTYSISPKFLEKIKGAGD